MFLDTLNSDCSLHIGMIHKVYRMFPKHITCAMFRMLIFLKQQNGIDLLMFDNNPSPKTKDKHSNTSVFR